MIEGFIKVGELEWLNPSEIVSMARLPLNNKISRVDILNSHNAIKKIEEYFSLAKHEGIKSALNSFYANYSNHPTLIKELCHVLHLDHTIYGTGPHPAGEIYIKTREGINYYVTELEFFSEGSTKW